jgi:hypothetical protein
MLSSSRARQAGSTTYLSSRRTTVYTHPPLELAATISCQYIYSLKYYCHLEWRTRPLKSKASTSDFPDLTPIAIVVDEPPWVLLSITLWVSTTRSIGMQNQGGSCDSKSGPMLRCSVRRNNCRSARVLPLPPTGNHQNTGSPPPHCVAHASRAQ